VAKAGVNNATVRSRLIVRRLIERQGSRFVVTDQGRAVLMGLIEGVTAAPPVRSFDWRK
jgi:hypothetical protein